MKRCVLSMIVALGVLLLSTSLSFTYASDRITLEPNPYARIYNVHLKRDLTGRSRLKGRVTRVEKDQRVPPGTIVVELSGANFTSVHSLKARYKPQFVHRKKKRASYFSVELPQEPDLSETQFRVYFLAD